METLEKNIRRDNRYRVKIPLTFSLIDRHTRKSICRYEGVMQDISPSGIKLSTKRLPRLLWDKIDRRDVYVRVAIQSYHHHKRGYEYDALPVWATPQVSSGRQRLAYVGASFMDTSRRPEREALVASLRRKKRFVLGMKAGVLFIVLALGVSMGVSSAGLRSRQQRLQSLLLAYQRYRAATENLYRIRQDLRDVTDQIAIVSKKVDSSKRAIEAVLTQRQKILSMRVVIPQGVLSDEQKALSQELDELQKKLVEYRIAHTLEKKEAEFLERKDGQLRLSAIENEGVLRRAAREKKWVREVLIGEAAGLLAASRSAPGPVRRVSVYEQALASIALLSARHRSEAADILDFLQRRFQKDLLRESYASNGKEIPGVPFSPHATLWAGVAASHFWHYTGDAKARRFAEQIADIFLFGNQRLSLSDHVVAYVLYQSLGNASPQSPYAQGAKKEEDYLLGVMRKGASRSMSVYEPAFSLLQMASADEAKKWGVDFFKTVGLIYRTIHKTVDVPFSSGTISLSGAAVFDGTTQQYGLSRSMSARLSLLMQRAVSVARMENSEQLAYMQERVDADKDSLQLLFLLQLLQQDAVQPSMRGILFSLEETSLFILAQTNHPLYRFPQSARSSDEKKGI